MISINKWMHTLTQRGFNVKVTYCKSIDKIEEDHKGQCRNSGVAEGKLITNFERFSGGWGRGFWALNERGTQSSLSRKEQWPLIKAHRQSQRIFQGDQQKNKHSDLTFFPPTLLPLGLPIGWVHWKREGTRALLILNIQESFLGQQQG